MNTKTSMPWVRRWVLPAIFAVFVGMGGFQVGSGIAQVIFVIPEDDSIPLLQPLDDSGDPFNPGSITPGANIQIFYDYFNMSWPWVLGVAAGIGVLWALVGGIQIMVSGDNTGMRDEGKNRLMWALAGLLLVGLAGLILQTLNPLYYIQV